MLYHIKFLKTPTPSKNTLRTVLTLSNDLGEQFFHGSAKIGVEVGNRRITADWKAGDRSIVIITPLGQTFRATVLSSTDDLFPNEEARFLDLYAVCVNGKFPAKSLRRFDHIPLVIEEDTGNSIARHVWDAGVTLAHTLTKERIFKILGNKDDKESLNKDKESEKQLVNVVELGAGCGIVGLAVEKHLQGQAHLVLSDLEEARECAQTSIKLNNSNGVFVTLDWDDTEGTQQFSNIDLIIVADCTYNMDMYDSLVGCLQRLLKLNPSAKVIIGHKMRNDQEEQFFQLLEEKLEVLSDTTESVGIDVRVVVAGKMS